MTRESFPAATERATAQDACDAGNARFPDGTEVRYSPAGTPIRTRTTSPALLAGRVAAVYLAASRVPVALRVLEPVTEETDR